MTNGKRRKKRFGTVRKLPSSRWQVRYTGPDGLRRTAPGTFDTKTAGERWLVEAEAEMLRGEWLDPEAGKVTLDEYAGRWIQEYERHLTSGGHCARLFQCIGSAQINPRCPATIGIRPTDNG